MSGAIWLWTDPLAALGGASGYRVTSTTSSGASAHCPCCPHRECAPPANPPDPRPSPFGPPCTLYGSLLMVIPPEGTTLSCPAHPEGHFVRGSSVTC